jgi:hypothetical protein
MENGFSNLSLTTSNQSISGSKDYKVQTLDFDTSCPCQITACDGGTIKVCGKIEFDPPPEYKGDICDFDSDAYLQGFVAKESFGYSLCKDTATCGPPFDDGIENKALIGLPDSSGFISTILQTESPGMTGTSASVAIFAPDATVATTGGKCINIVGGSGSNVDVNLQTGDPQGSLSVVSSRNMTLNCIGGNTPSTEGNLNIEASYGKIDIRATGLDTISYTRSQDIDITAQRGSIVLTPELYGYTPGLGAREGYTVMNNPQIAGFNINQIPTNTGQSVAGQLRIYQEPSPSPNVWWYVSVVDHVGGTIKWYKTQMTPA